MSLLGYVLLLTAALYCSAAPAPPEGSCQMPVRSEEEALQGDWDKDWYPPSTIATFNCRPGYSRLGSIKKICLNGKWDYVGNRGQCRKKSCGHPGDIPFGSFQLREGDSFVFGAIVQYDCDEGYQMVSREKSRECTANGWSNFPPHCEVRNCPPVEAADNINVLSTSYDDEYSVGQVVRFECKDPSFKLDSASEIFCTSEGDWNLKPPKCVEISCKVPIIDNGKVDNPKKNDYKNNEVIQFSCIERYHPNTNRDIKCTKDDWYPKPSCDEIICSPYSPVEKGKLVVVKNVYKFDEEIEVKCDDGYVLQNEPNKRRKCTSNGWSPPARCVSKKCDRPNIKYGSIYHDYWYPKDVGRTLDYQCETNYLSHERRYWGRTTCTNLGWDPEPKCSRQCSYSKVYFENADLVSAQSTYLEGEKMFFRCQYDYQTPEGKDNGERTCLPNGEFTPAKCTKTCKAPKLPNGKLKTIKNDFEIRESVQYECNEGYMTESRKHVGRADCNIRGWSEELKCIPITCFYRGKTYKAGDVVEYTCSRGQMTTYESGQCFLYGWGPPPHCVDITSECTIPVTSNLILSPHWTSYPSGRKVSFSCKDGFSRVGPLESTCTDDDWDPPLPTCKEIKCTIPEEANLVRNPLRQVYKENDLVSLRCENGYTQKGSSHSTCTQNGWNPRLPFCDDESVQPEATDSPTDGKGKPEEKPVQPEATESPTDGSGKQVQPGETELPQFEEKKEEKPVQPDATDSPTDDKGKQEKRKKCTQAYNPVHAEIKDPKKEYYSNDIVTISCVRGYKMYGSPIVRCIEGKWEEPPECIQSTPCRQPPRIHNGAITESSIQEAYVTDDIVTYSCEPGFHISGPDQTTCVSGQWTVLPTCTENSCDQPPEVTHARSVERKETFKHGEKAKYECGNDFRFSGEDSARCVKGKWLSIPTCVETSCKPPPRIAHATIDGKSKASYATGEKVTYVCDPGYSLERSLTGEAQCENTNWINSPVCKQIGQQCGPPPTVQSGDTVRFRKTIYESGERVEYKCPDFYLLQGNRIVRCLNGDWDEAPICIEPCTASEKDMRENNIHLKWVGEKKMYSTHGQTIEFTCIASYKNPPGTQMRVKCEQGKLNYPKCYKSGFCVLDQPKMISHNIHYNVSNIVDPGLILFQCNEGMTPENGLEAKCESSKINYPKCITAKGCKAPEITNGFLRPKQDSYDSGSSVEFDCNESYVKNNAINVKCEKGEWSELPVCHSPCKISEADLDKYNIQLLPSDDSNILGSNHRHGTQLGVTCKSKFRRPNQAALVIECYGGKFKYTRCFSGKTCRIDQEKLDDNNLELDEVHDNEVFYEDGGTVQFKCKDGYRRRGTPTARCSKETLNYPKCTASS